MPWIKTLGPDEAPEELQRAYSRMADPLTGRISNILQIHSLDPGVLEAHHELYKRLMRGTPALRRVDRELLAVTVSRINDCHY